MQPLSWYLRRLAAMSPREAAGRAADAARDAADALRVSAGWTPAPPTALLEAGEPRFRVSDVSVGEWAAAPPGSAEAAWRDRLVEAANEVEAHRLTFFDLEGHDLGRTIDWNRDYKSGRRAPLRFGRWVDYRDFSRAGDCKLVWEPNRHHQLVVLARAYRATGQKRYARAVLEQLESWLDACPFGRGMNWRSTLELGIRLINWVWALDLVREAGLPEEPLRSRVLASVHRSFFRRLQHLFRRRRQFQARGDIGVVAYLGLRQRVPRRCFGHRSRSRRQRLVGAVLDLGQALDGDLDFLRRGRGPQTSILDREPTQIELGLQDAALEEVQPALVGGELLGHEMHANLVPDHRQDQDGAERRHRGQLGADAQVRTEHREALW